MSVPSRSDSTVKACAVSMLRLSSAKIACASASVRPTTGITPGMTRTLSAGRGRSPRPAPSAPCRRPAPRSWSFCAVNTTSAMRAASAWPGPEEPAWISTGWPCGARGTLSAALDGEVLALEIGHVEAARPHEAAGLPCRR